MDEGIPQQEETEAAAAPEQKVPYQVPLRELDVGKAGVSDLFEKINQVIRYLNALDIKPKVQ